MNWCADPFLNYLKSFGYNVVRFPKADVKPLQVLAKFGNHLERLGELTTILRAGTSIPVPPISNNVIAAGISGQRTSDLNIGIGLSLLSSILVAMGGSSAGLDTHYQQARKVVFEFHEVLEDKVELARLDQYLTNADLSPFSRYGGQLLEADRVYVTTATIKSQKFSLEAKQSDGTKLEVSVPKIQGIVGGNVTVSTQSGSTSRLTYEGKEPLVFGFQAFQIFYDQGRYSSFEPVESGLGMRSGSSSKSINTRRLETEGPFLRFDTGRDPLLER